MIDIQKKGIKKRIKDLSIKQLNNMDITILK